VLEGFIAQRLDNIQKKAQFTYKKNQKELINLETRRFIIDNYREIAEIARNSSSDEEREEKLKSRFSVELKALQEKIETIQEKSLGSPEKTINSEKDAINRILDTPASFRQFTPERREKLQNDVEKLQKDNEEQQLVINQLEKRKEILIQELQELKNNYSHDKRRTEKTIEKCSLHQNQLVEHKAISHACGISCPQLRELQKAIRECNNCQERDLEPEPTEDVEIIIKREDKNGRSELKKHKESHPCGITCEKARQIQKEIKECDTCQNSELFIKQIRKQIKCKQVVDLLKIKKEENKENLLLFLIKKDNNCEKKVLTATKTQISSDSKLKKTIYCKKHWLELERLEKHKTKAEKEVREEKEIMEERIIKSTLSHESKTEILKDLKIISGSKNKEIMKKIANSPVDLTISEVAVQEQIQDLKQKGTNYQKKSVAYKTQHEKIATFKKNK
ncbi:4784_t:CDS:2, partial [Paraglomus occultum]